MASIFREINTSRPRRQTNSSSKAGRIRLEFDVEKKDRYGRILAYAYVGSIFVNARLIEEGYARFSAPAKNVRHQNVFLDLEEKAKKAEVGIWAKVDSRRKNDLKGKVEIDIEKYFCLFNQKRRKISSRQLC